MKLGREKYEDKYEYDLICGFDNQVEFDKLSDFIDHAYNQYCDSYEESQLDLLD